MFAKIIIYIKSDVDRITYYHTHMLLKYGFQN